MSDPVNKPEQKPPVELPEPLKGKKPEEVYAMVLDEYKAMEAERDAAKKEAEELKKKSAVNQQTPPVQAAYQMPPTLQVNNQSLWDNSQDYMDQQVAARIAPLKQQMLENQYQINASTFWSRCSEEDKKYQREVEILMGQLVPEVRANPKAYEAMLNYVKGTKVKDIVQERESQVREAAVKETLTNLGLNPTDFMVPEPKTILRPGVVPATPRQYQVNPKKAPKLDEEQRRVAANMGISEEEFKTWEEKEAQIIL